MLLGLIAYVLYKARGRHGTIWNKYGPTLFVIASFPLIMADPLRHVLQDGDVWLPPGSSEYRPDCHDETFHCLSVLGVFFTIIFTYTGFLLLVIGTMWNANLCAKLRQIRLEWTRIREESA